MAYTGTFRENASAAVGLGRASAAGADINAGFNRSYLGRSLKIGAMESLGFSMKGPMFGVRNLQNLGFLGTGLGAPGGMRAALADIRSPAIQSGNMQTMAKSLAQGNAATSRMGIVKRTGTGAGRFLGRAFGGAAGLAATGLLAYTGYQREGAWGAVKGAGESVLWSAGIRAVGGIIGSATVGIGMAVAGIGIGTYALGEKGREYRQRSRELELTGGPKIMENIHGIGATTMRQRSLLALQNTHINGRMALGNEALLTHTPFR